jgi:hypothetical protein
MMNSMSPGTVAVILALAVVSACTTPLSNGSSASVPTTSRVSPTAPPAIGPLGAPGCRPPSPTGAFTGEVYGTAVGGTVWGWFMQAYPPQAGVEDKTVWRLDTTNGVGSPNFKLVGPARQPGHLDFGPEEHGGSTWNRPGREFGTGLVFTAAGCWDVHVTLGQLSGDVYVLVT